jgi:hypothetical protein
MVVQVFQRGQVCGHASCSGRIIEDLLVFLTMGRACFYAIVDEAIRLCGRKPDGLIEQHDHLLQPERLENSASLHFLLNISKHIGYKKKCEARVSFMRSSSSRNSRKHAAAAADRASRQLQILDRLSAEYAQRVHEVLPYRPLVKGSVCQIQTRCGNPSCHCAKPRGARHAATVLSWSEAGKTRIRSIAQADRARLALPDRKGSMVEKRMVSGATQDLSLICSKIRQAMFSLVGGRDSREIST